jgi:hypothetical protein
MVPVFFLNIKKGSLFFFTKDPQRPDDFEMNHSYDHLLCRFVTDSTGRKIGESIAVSDDILIIKRGVKFMGVPLKHVEDQKKTILVKGLINFDKAYELGEEWRKSSFQDMEEESLLGKEND